MSYSWMPVVPGMNDDRAAYGHTTVPGPLPTTWAMIWYDDAPAQDSPDYGTPSQYSYQVQVPYEYYADVEVTTNINGALAAQTLLMPRAGWVPQIGLFYDEVGPVGDVEVLLTRCTGGKADPQRVISRATLARADMKTYPEETILPVMPFKVAAGERIGIIEISQGNHFITMGDPGYSEGTFFRGTAGGEYLQGDLTQDRKVKVYMANFVQPRTEVALQNISLAGGMSDLSILTEQPALDGASLTFEMQIAGKWEPVTGQNLGKLSGTPDIVPLRAVFLGTADIQCGLQLGAGRVVASRPTLSSTITSEPIAVSAKRYFQVDLLVNRWDPAKNTVTAQILTGVGFATVTASSTAVVLDEGTLNGWKRLRFTFDVGAPVNAYKVKTTLTRAADGVPVRRMERTSVATG